MLTATDKTRPDRENVLHECIKSPSALVIMDMIGLSILPHKISSYLNVLNASVIAMRYGYQQTNTVVPSLQKCILIHTFQYRFNDLEQSGMFCCTYDCSTQVI